MPEIGIARSLFIFLGIWLTQLKHEAKILISSKIKFIISAAIAVFFILIIGFGFYRLISYVKDTPIVGMALVSRLVSSVFLTLFVLIVYSSVITAFSTLYFSDDNNFLIISPFHSGGVLLGKLFQTAFYSSWMSVIIIIPLIATLGLLFKIPLYFHLVFIVGLLNYFIAAAAVGMIGVVLVVKIFPARKIRDFLILALVLAGTSLYILFRLLNLEQILRPGKESIAADFLKIFAVPRMPYLPSYHISRMVNSFIGGGGSWLAAGLSIIGLTLTVVIIYYFVSRKLFYNSWERVQSEEKKRYNSRYFPKNPIFAKDIKTFFRDTAQWTQTLLIALLMIIYIFNIYKLPLDIPYIHYLIAFLNTGMVAFVIAAVGLRFSFASMSQEGKNFWILLSSPLNMKKLFVLKYIQNFIPVQIMGILLILVSNYILKAPYFLSVLSIITIFFAGISLTSLGMGMGCLYPKFDADSPAQIETSYGAIMYMIYSFFYIGLTISIQAVWVRMYFMSSVRGGTIYAPVVWVVIILLVIMNILMNVIPVKLGIRNLKNLEFSV